MPSRWRRAVNLGVCGVLSLGIGLGMGLGVELRAAPPAAADPRIAATTIVSGLSLPWDLTWIGELMLYDQRGGTVWSKRAGAAPRAVSMPGLAASTFVGSEAGLLGLVADPAAASNGYFYTCSATKNASGSPVDVRVRRWHLDSDTAASPDRVVVSGLPITSGRHSGCRLRFGPDGKLYVGTGDAVTGTNPQNLNSLGGKVLRVNGDGSIPSDNPYASRSGNARYVWNYGHRNVQGLAWRPGTNQMWSAEHGTDRDDEINLLVRGGNYGWDPVPGYDESTPMTNLTRYPNAQRAIWSSGDPTLATSGLTFLTGAAWGRFQGAMAVGLLKAEGILIVTLTPGGQLAHAERLPVADGYGRIRATQQGPDGALYFTTSNGTDDKIVRLAPSPARALPSYTPGLDVSPVGVAAARSGADLYVFVRTTGNVISYRRSADNGATWTTWASTGVVSSSAPAAASSAAGRIDLLTRSSSGSAVHTWFDNGVRTGQEDLGGFITAAPAVVSAGDGTLDVFVRGSGAYGAARKRYDGGGWSSWQQLGGEFTSALSASVNRSTGVITVTGRGRGGGAHARTVTATSNGSGWPWTGLMLWSARALGDTASGVGLVGVSSGSDSNAVVDRGPLVMAVAAVYNSAPAVVTRPDGTWVMFGRSSNGGVWLYDARPGGYRNVYLGGIVR